MTPTSAQKNSQQLKLSSEMVLKRSKTKKQGILYETPEGIADWTQDPLGRNFAGGTACLSGRLHPSHTFLLPFSPLSLLPFTTTNKLVWGLGG